MTDTILAENSTSSQRSKSSNVDEADSDRFTIARVEMNFEKLPIWSPKPRRASVLTPSKVIELEPEKLPNGQVVARKVEIIPSTKYGYPTTQTQEYWYAIQKIWHDSPEKEAGRVEFSRSQLIKGVLGKAYGRNARKTFDLNINQLCFTGFKFEHLIYDKEQDTTHQEIRNFNLIVDSFLTKREKTEKVIHDKCSLTLHPLIVSNLRSGFFKPILLSVVVDIKSDFARLLYRKLDTQFSNYTKYEISSERFFREHGIEGKKYKTPSGRKQNLADAIDELIGKPTSSGAIIDRYEFRRTADSKDWKLIVRSRKGESLLGKNRSKPSQKETEKIYQSLVKVKSKSNLEQQSFSFEEPSKTDNVVPVTEKNNDKVQPKASSTKLVKEVLEHFRTVFFDGNSDFEFTKKDRSKASILIEKYGVETTKSIITKAKVKTDKDKFYPKSLAGLGKYFNDALKHIEEERTLARVQQIERNTLHKQSIDNERYDHEKEYSAKYYEYVDSVLKAMVLALPQEYQAFYEGEAQKLSELQQEVENAPRQQKKIKEVMLKSFNRPAQKFCRAVDFFKDKEIKIPDFWTWDNTQNPEGFGKD